MIRLCLLLPALVVTKIIGAVELPYTPINDSVVLERVTEPRLPGTVSLRKLRDAWAAKPAFLPGALAYARAALELNRREEDPRYLGYAEASLALWLGRQQPPPEVLLLRASLRFARVDYVGAEQDLRVLIDSAAPEGHVARISRSSIYISRGDPAAALADCEAAKAHVSRLVASTCTGAARVSQARRRLRLPTSRTRSSQTRERRSQRYCGRMLSPQNSPSGWAVRRWRENISSERCAV